MQSGRIGITALITLLAAGTTALIPYFPAQQLSAPPALAQTSTDQKAEAEGLFQQGMMMAVLKL
jgi:hypothetical protein